MRRCSISVPLIRVCAVNSIVSNGFDFQIFSSISKRLCASLTILRPSGVSSVSELINATSASKFSLIPLEGRNNEAWRLPYVMVPVLSSNSTSTSPAASTARPEVAMTLACIIRLIPATPIADNKPPIVVGIRQTSNATKITIEMGSP